MNKIKDSLREIINDCQKEIILEQKSLDEYNSKSKEIISKHFNSIIYNFKSIEKDLEKRFDFANSLKEDDWYKELEDLLFNCKIKNVITADLKYVLKDWIKDWKNLVGKTGDDNQKFKTDMKKLLLVNNTDDFIKQFLIFIKTHCIEINKEDKYFISFKSDVLYMICRVLVCYKYRLRDLNKEANVLNDLLLVFALNVTLENKISIKDVNVIKSMTYYGENNCKPVILKMLNMIEQYNTTLTEKQMKERMSEVKSENLCLTNVDTSASYQDEEECFSIEEKQMLNQYLNENVFDKFISINNAYNPKVLIDAEEFYENIPCTNINEAFDLIMKELKSRNVNHEINNLIIKLNLLHKGKRKIKK